MSRGIQRGDLRWVHAGPTFQSAASFSLASSFFFSSATAASSAGVAAASASASWLSDAGLASVSPSFFCVSCGAASLYHRCAEGCILGTVTGAMKVWGREKDRCAMERVIERRALEGVTRACRSILGVA